MSEFNDMQPIKARIAYIQNKENSSMIVGGLVGVHGDGRLWHMVDCDIIIIPKKTYVQARKEVMSREFVAALQFVSWEIEQRAREAIA